MRRALFLLVPAAVIGFVVAGCGGGSKESAGTTTRAATTATPTSTLASAKDCKDLADLGQKFSSALSGAGNPQNLKKQAELLKEFAERTPSDIRADFRLLAAYLSKVADVAGSIKPGETPSAEMLAKLQKVAAEVNQAKLTAAGTRISAWVKKNCAK